MGYFVGYGEKQGQGLGHAGGYGFFRRVPKVPKTGMRARARQVRESHCRTGHGFLAPVTVFGHGFLSGTRGGQGRATGAKSVKIKIIESNRKNSIRLKSVTKIESCGS